MITKLLFLSIFNIILYANKYYYDGNQKVYLTSIDKSIRDLQENSSQFKTQNGTYLSIDNTFIVKIKEDVNIQNLIDEYNLLYIKQLYTNTYLLQINNNEDIFDISNKLHLDNRTIFSHPNFKHNIHKR